MVNHLEREPAEETGITITAIIEVINRSMSSKNSSMHEDTQVVLEENRESSGQNNPKESSNSLTREQSTTETGPTAKNPPKENIDSILSVVIPQESIINDLIISREEFTLIEDPDSLEEIVIYDMVIEYQATIDINKNIDDDITEIKAEPQENNSEDTAKQLISLSQA